jgi:ADP-ribose pyrophosphatase YjhB (NUDIX family)
MRLPIQVVEAIIFRRNGDSIEYLLLKRLPERNGFWHWQPVTGCVEERETRTEALRREITEETGIKNLIMVIEDLYYRVFKPQPESGIRLWCRSVFHRRGSA